MQHLNDDDRREILGEVFLDELKIIREYLEDILGIKHKVTTMDERLGVVEADVKVIKAVVTDHSQQLNSHEIRLTSLEAG